MTPIHHICISCADMLSVERWYTKHFGFTRGQLSQSLLDAAELRPFLHRLLLPLDCGLNRREQCCAIDRLDQEIDCACLHRVNDGRRIRRAGNKDNRSIALAVAKRGLQLASVDARHPQIENNAARNVVVMAGKKLLR